MELKELLQKFGEVLHCHACVHDSYKMKGTQLCSYKLVEDTYGYIMKGL